MSRGEKQAFLPRLMVALLISCCTGLVVARAARAECPADWLPGEGRPGVTGDLPVWALTAWDPDGAGPQPQVLLAGGGFEGAGDVPAQSIATWDGSAWHQLGSPGWQGTNGQVFALTVYNGEVIAGGDFTMFGGVGVNRIARWESGSASWHPLGSGLNSTVRALAVYNGELYAGGFFTQAGGAPASGIARWNGSSWQGVGGGVSGPTFAVFAFTIFDGTLVVGGGFTTAGGMPAKNFASWNGSSWQSLAGNNPGESISTANALAVYNGELFAAANVFNASNGQFLRSVSRWDGATWQALGNGPDDSVLALSAYNGALYAGGIFTNAGGGSLPNRLARWDGSSWSAVPTGPGDPARRVQSLVVFNGDLIAGGLSSKANGLQTSAVGRFDGSAWHYLGGGVNFVVATVASYQGDLFIGGSFSQAGDIEVSAIARRLRDGTWDSLLGGVSGDCCGSGTFVNSMVAYDESLVVSGSFTAAGGVPVNGIARWNGESWQAFSSAFAGNLFVHDGELFGTIVSANPTTSQVAQWHPRTQLWQPLGTLPLNVGIVCFTVFNGELIAGGLGGSGAPAAVFRWDGSTWNPMGGTFGFNTVDALAVYNGELIAGGLNDPFSGGPPGGIIRWTGSSWQTLGGGLFEEDTENFTNGASCLIVFNGDLIVAGLFSHAGSAFGVPANNIARWNGSSWSGMGTGTNDHVLALGEHEGGLLLGGWFTMAGGSPHGHWARWGPALGDLDQDGGVDLADWILFAGCLSGPGAMAPAGCDCADADSDGDVDLVDAAVFQNRFVLP